MKKMILLLALMPLMVSGQQHFPLVKDGAIWREVVTGKNEPPTTWYMIRSQMLMEGDTVFNNQTYRKLYFSDYSPSISNKVFYGGMREDTLGRVYFYVGSNQHAPGGHLQSQTEYLLYDFSLQVGDTLQVLNNFNLIQVLSSIDSVLIDNQYRKLYRFNANDPREVIEGIGSVKGLFFPLVYEFEHGQLLTCYEDEDIFWNNPALLGNDCFSVGMDESRPEPNFVRVYPVPVSDQLHVVFVAVPNDQVTIHIYDLTGRLMEAYLVAGQKEITLDVATLKQGIYILQVSSNCSASKSFKVIKH